MVSGGVGFGSGGTDIDELLSVLLSTDLSDPNGLETLAAKILQFDRLAGKRQVFERNFDLAQAAATYKLWSATLTGFILESIIIQLPSVDVSNDANITSISIHTNRTTPAVFLSTANGAKANLTATATLGWSGLAYLVPGITDIELTIAGGAADETTSCTVAASGWAVNDGGRLT